MKILAYDHRTARYGVAGGMLSCAGFPADRPLLALLGDLCRVQGVEITLLRDPALAPLNLPASVHLVSCKPEHAAETMMAGIDNADAVWPVMPESAGMLERASSDILERGKLLIGSRPDAIRVAASKYRTAQVLKAAGIAVVLWLWRRGKASGVGRGSTEMTCTVCQKEFSLSSFIRPCKGPFFMAEQF